MMRMPWEVLEMSVEYEDAIAPAGPRPTRTVKVMIVEDHKVVAEGLQSLIGREPDLEVVGLASTVEEAGRLGRESRPEVLLVDFRLPDGNGAEAVAVIRKVVPKVRVLFLSAVDSPAALMTAIQVGARGYLLKANAAEEVVAAVRRIAAGEMLISASALAALIAEKGEQTHLLDTLTHREREVLRLMAQGLDNRTLAKHLGVEYGTVRSHVRNLIAKLKVHNRMQAIVRAAQLGLLEPESVGLPHLD
jgi:DNA-binding NarL/FixJ family response regulator